VAPLHPPSPGAAPVSTTVAVAGSTGSIGVQTLEVIAEHLDRFRVVALAAGRSVDVVVEQARRWRPELVVLADEDTARRAAGALPAGTEVVVGRAGLEALGRAGDVVVNGVVGFAGLPVTLAALEAGRRLALANKESLIAAGPVVQRARRTPGAELVPVDSEHAAIHQCLRANTNPARVARLQLTASGGPFRGRSPSELADVTIADALAHPTWSMGPKITIDSSTLMNKGLEVIEAHELFGPPAGDAGFGVGLEEIQVVVHPQSIVHSMVTFDDGSTIAQLSQPTMKLPIGYALCYPDRLPTSHGGIDWSAPLRLDFEPPDLDAFPCLGLAYDAARAGGTAPAWLSGANEVAVEAFLEGRIGWVDIPAVLAEVLSSHDGGTADTLDDVLEGDRRARALAGACIDRRGSR
jgi:1-deoxy-D-xylulose-5-phosphate reductoisomerase